MKASPILLSSLLLWLAAGPAQAEGSLYKCDADGAISIQSDPCPRGAVEVWRRDAAPEPEPTPEELAARAALAQAEAARRAEEALRAEQARAEEAARQAAAERARSEVAPEPPVGRSECSRAHEFVEAVDAKPWLELSDIARTRLREWVAAQCRNVDAPIAAVEPVSL